MTDTPAEPRRADRLVAYPTKFSSPLNGNREATTSWVLGFCLALSLLANCAQSFVTVGLFPLKTVVPLLLQLDSLSNQIVHVRPFETGVDGTDLVIEKQIGTYTKARIEIVASSTEQVRLWGDAGFVRGFTDAAEFENFRQRTRPEEARLRGLGLTRAAEILAVATMTPVRRGQEGFFTVDAISVDRDSSGRELNRQAWTASLTVTLGNEAVRAGNRYENPYRLKVTGFSIKEKRAETDQQKPAASLVPARGMPPQ
jgi:type IV secretory pathway component VirB8